MPAGQVRLENIGKRYGDIWAVRHVDLEIAQGEFYTLLGPSGCGKRLCSEPSPALSRQTRAPSSWTAIR
jgi:ABC-type dipeptide/oligopeptide/nickel transport system ATPase subunit